MSLPLPDVGKGFPMLILQQDDELSGKESPLLSGPAGYFWQKVYFQTMSIFRHMDHVL